MNPTADTSAQLPKPRPYLVTVTRVEEISFQLDALDAQDAQARYLADGDEVASTTTSITVDAVEAGTADEVFG